MTSTFSTATTHLFLGPTARSRELVGRENFVIHPPAMRGDILDLISERPRRIVLIDGFFGDRPSISHREILDAINDGIPVYGAASMGALRAAELSTLGMLGAGKIFRFYKAGILTDDDEVAVLHAPKEFEYEPLTFAIVDLRATLREAARAGLIARTTACEIVSIAKSIPIEERTLSNLIDEMQVRMSNQEVITGSQILSRSWINQKWLDAVATLASLEDPLRAPFPSTSSASLDALETSWYCKDFLRYNRNAEGIADIELWDAARLFWEGYPAFHFQAISIILNAQDRDDGDNDSSEHVISTFSEHAGVSIDILLGRCQDRGVKLSHLVRWARLHRLRELKRPREYDPRDALLRRDSNGGLPAEILLCALKLSDGYEHANKQALRARDANRLLLNRSPAVNPLDLSSAFVLEHFFGCASGETPRNFWLSHGFEGENEFIASLKRTHVMRALS